MPDAALEILAVTCSEGTCVEDCPMYGFCHCGCGGATSKMRWNSRTRGYVHERHHRYLWGHFIPSNPYDGDKCGIAYQEVRGMVDALFEELGLRGAAARVGVTTRAVTNWHNGHVAHVQPGSAKKIEDAWEVLNRPLRRILVPMPPLREWMREHEFSPKLVWGERHRWYEYVTRRPHVSYIVADEMAISLGVHPSEVWPNWHDMEPAAKKSRNTTTRRLPPRCEFKGCYRKASRRGHVAAHEGAA